MTKLLEGCEVSSDNVGQSRMKMASATLICPLQAGVCISTESFTSSEY